MANSFDTCIRAALEAKRITATKADELRDQIERAQQSGLSLADEQRAALALGQLDRLEADILRRKANTIRQARMDRWNAAEATAHPKGAAWGAASKLVRDVSGMARWGNVDSQSHILQKRFHAKVTEAIAALRAKGIFGQTQDFELGEKMALELRGVDTGNAEAKGFAKAFSGAFEEARTLFNKAGGMIGKRADWGTPQPHNAGEILRAGLDEWKAFAKPLLDASKMVRDDGTPLTPADLDEVLEGAYKSITGTKVSRHGGASKANSRQDHRVLVFKDGESWLKYNRRFGEADILGAFTSHLDGMARDIAQMQVLGPNPAAGVVALQEALVKDMEGRALTPMQDWLRAKGWKVNNAEAAARRVEGLWDTVRGNPAAVGFLSQMSKAARDFQVSTKLGGAAVSSLADEGTMAHTALWNGLDPIRLLRRELDQLTKEEYRQFAMRAWLGWDSWTRNGVATNRFADEALGKGYAATFAEGTMRASGLNVVTDARRAAFGTEMLGALGDLAGRSLDQIRAENPRLADALGRYGIKSSDWDAMRANAVDFDGATYLHPQAILDAMPNRAGEALTEKLMRLVLTETDFAVPTPGALERYLVTGGTKAGTAAGEVVRHLFQFKTFPVTMLTTHFARGLFADGAAKKAAYLVPFFVLTTGMGALVLQARSLLQGRDPMDMSKPEFWGAAAAQGGGTGLLGDFFYQGVTGTSRFGNNLAASLMGPTIGLIGDAGKVALTGLQGDLTPKGAVDFATRHLMPGSSLWYARLAIDRMVKDQLVSMADPAGARRTFLARERFYREQGSQFWWKPGEFMP